MQVTITWSRHRIKPPQSLAGVLSRLQQRLAATAVTALFGTATAFFASFGCRRAAGVVCGFIAMMVMMLVAAALLRFLFKSFVASAFVFAFLFGLGHLYLLFINENKIEGSEASPYAFCTGLESPRWARACAARSNPVLKRTVKPKPR